MLVPRKCPDDAHVYVVHVIWWPHDCIHVFCEPFVTSGEQATQQWYDEIKDYNFARNSGPNTGHFTQVVWKSSQELGVGRAQTKDGKWLVVANYLPAGNFIGRYGDNVFPVGGSTGKTSSSLGKQSQWLNPCVNWTPAIQDLCTSFGIKPDNVYILWQVRPLRCRRVRREWLTSPNVSTRTASAINQQNTGQFYIQITMDNNAHVHGFPESFSIIPYCK